MGRCPAGAGTEPQEAGKGIKIAGELIFPGKNFVCKARGKEAVSELYPGGF